MKLYDNNNESNYEQLKKIYPAFYQDIAEMDALWGGFGTELDIIRSSIVQSVDNCFVWETDETTVEKLETFLYLPIDRTKQLYERKSLIASFILGIGHIGEKEIRDAIQVFTDGEIAMELIGGTIRISVTRDIADRFNLADCIYILSLRLPAHLALDLVDILLPVSLKNNNVFTHNSLNISSSFSNRGKLTGVLLDGSRLLDGEWKLNQSFKGILFDTFAVGTSLLNKQLLGSDNISIKGHRFVNTEIAEVSFDTFVNFRNDINIAIVKSQFSTSFINTEVLPGTITIDRLYYLDGAYMLNGERQLNAEIFTEEI